MKKKNILFMLSFVLIFVFAFSFNQVKASTENDDTINFVQFANDDYRDIDVMNVHDDYITLKINADSGAGVFENTPGKPGEWDFAFNSKYFSYEKENVNDLKPWQYIVYNSYKNKFYLATEDMTGIWVKGFDYHELFEIVSVDSVSNVIRDILVNGPSSNYPFIISTYDEMLNGSLRIYIEGEPSVKYSIFSPVKSGDYVELIDVLENGSLIVKYYESVSEDLKPVLDGETAFICNIDNLLSVDDIMSHISAYDNEDGDITHLITVENSTYNENITEIGEYLIQLSVKDSAGNEANLVVHVFVKDITPPIISGKSTYNQSYTKKLDVSTILSALSVNDNYDTGLQIQVKTDNYTAKYTELGAKTIIFKTVDNSGNAAEYTVTVNVIDDVPPVFSGPTTIMKGQKQILSLQSILSQISVNDVKDLNVEFTVITDDYTGKGGTVGDWLIKLKATDNAGNTAYHEITITVVDDIPPVFYVDNFFINVEDVVHLTRQDIIDILTASGQISGGGIMSVSFVIDDYTDNEDVPGIYPMAVSYDSSNGSGGLVSFAIQVLSTAEEDEDPIIIEEPELSFWKKITKPFEDVWSWLKKPVVEDGKFVYGYLVAAGFILLIVGGLLLFKPTKRNYRRRGRY